VDEPVEEHRGLALAKKHSIRQRQKDETRRRITEAALEVFAEEGFVAARIDEIAKRAGIGRTTFYLHFQTKIDLANEIGMAMFGTFNRYVRQLGAIDPDDGDAIEDWFNRYREAARRRRVSLAVSTQANMSDPELAEDLMDVYREYAFSIATAVTGEDRPSESAIELGRYLMIALDRMLHITSVQGVRATPELRHAAVEHIRFSLRLIRATTIS
jgi:AcrR family transcriptional regulator